VNIYSVPSGRFLKPDEMQQILHEPSVTIDAEVLPIEPAQPADAKILASPEETPLTETPAEKRVIDELNACIDLLAVHAGITPAELERLRREEP
jgi:hypothetical protein